MNLGVLLSKRNKSHFYIMHLSYDGDKREQLWNYAKQNNLIGLDLPGVVTRDWNKTSASAKSSIRSGWVRQFDLFCNDMKARDIVLVLNGWDSLLGVAEVTEDTYIIDRKLTWVFFNHMRRVQWIKKYEYTSRLTLPHPTKGFNNTLSKIQPNTKLWVILTNLSF